MNWGKSIALVFVLFAIFITTLAMICFRQDVSLVSKNYYGEDLRYQETYERRMNAEQMSSKPQVLIAADNLSVSYSHLDSLQDITLALMRPSDASLDQVFFVDPQSDTLWSVSIPTLASGRYNVRLEWRQGATLYQLNRAIVL